jgi:hypothetical protein
MNKCSECENPLTYHNHDDVMTLAWSELGLGMLGLCYEISKQNPDLPRIARADLKGYWQCDKHPEVIWFDVKQRRKK